MSFSFCVHLLYAFDGTNGLFHQQPFLCKRLSNHLRQYHCFLLFLPLAVLLSRSLSGCRRGRVCVREQPYGKVNEDWIELQEEEENRLNNSNGTKQ